MEKKENKNKIYLESQADQMKHTDRQISEREAVKKALECLTDSERNLISRYYLSENPPLIREIAKELGVKPTTAWARIDAARNKMLKYLQDSNLCDELYSSSDDKNK